jgi:hypothetical protein
VSTFPSRQVGGRPPACAAPRSGKWHYNIALACPFLVEVPAGGRTPDTPPVRLDLPLRHLTSQHEIMIRAYLGRTEITPGVRFVAARMPGVSRSPQPPSARRRQHRRPRSSRVGAGLVLTEERRFSSGVVYLRYRVRGPGQGRAERPAGSARPAQDGQRRRAPSRSRQQLISENLRQGDESGERVNTGATCVSTHR